jgi:hypothetical protein
VVRTVKKKWIGSIAFLLISFGVDSKDSLDELVFHTLAQQFSTGLVERRSRSELASPIPTNDPSAEKTNAGLRVESQAGASLRQQQSSFVEESRDSEPVTTWTIVTRWMCVN